MRSPWTTRAHAAGRLWSSSSRLSTRKISKARPRSRSLVTTARPLSSAGNLNADDAEKSGCDPCYLWLTQVAGEEFDDDAVVGLALFAGRGGKTKATQRQISSHLDVRGIRKAALQRRGGRAQPARSEEHTSDLQSPYVR